MHPGVVYLLDPAKLGPAQTHRHVTLFPLAAPPREPAYIPLGKALTEGVLTIGEISESGSVPTLRVENAGKTPVLILDGEELVGARQNRVLNTTVLVPGLSTMTVPVSCVEQGRWSYQSRTFDVSDAVMARKARYGKSRSVSANLAMDRGFQSDQGKVWDDVAEVLSDVGAASPTGAMREAYESKRESLDAWAAHFPRIEGQTGFLCFIAGKPAGLDALSRPEVYRDVHDKLLRSYLLDAISAKPSDGPEEADPAAFLDALAALPETAYPSIGMGDDLRYDGEALCGSALAVDGACVHCAFFANEDRPASDTPRDPGLGRMTNPSVRRSRRRPYMPEE